MKEFLSSKLEGVKQFLAPKLSRAKELLISAFGRAKEFLSHKLDNPKEFLSSRFFKLLLLILFLVLVLVIGLSRCSAEPKPADIVYTGIVSIDTLEVHKKPDANSRVLGQLPLDLEIDILEEVTSGETAWGRIDALQLPDGKKIKGGWVDLDFVKSPEELAAEEEAKQAEAEPAIRITMGTITASKLNVRKGPGSEHETVGAYYKGDRVEILETQTVDDTVWGRTVLGWVGMGYVRMDGTYTSDSIESDNPDAPKVISDGNREVLGYGIVTLNSLNVRLGPGTLYGIAGTVSRGARYAYYQVTDGWARMEDGWVSTEHFYIEGTATDNGFAGIVNTDSLNVRTGPMTSYMQVDTYVKDEILNIHAVIGDWGYTDKGWVFLEYVSPYYATGNCIVTRGLNIRKEPNADSEIVGSYTTGDRITVVEIVNNWGRTDLGWINMKFIRYE